ncbi:MAG TPA: U32 family peptidase [Clostridia bacterium]|nr:U32 family peptidase [Clostridia bacterium]
MKKAELLAPAGDYESFIRAVENGADAVYFGLPSFNARIRADNFTPDNLRETVEHAHFFGVKVYITVNTVLCGAEFKELLPLVKAAVSAKADAFIVQDLGVARALKKCFPNIVLHASTQLGVHNAPGAKIAEKLDIKRVVLSRETPLFDISEIKKSTNLELEYFVHGALCSSFSGNCYMSGIEHGASGNRGLCKQLCRLEYSAESEGIEKSGYFLSTRDLCLIKSLGELSEAGIDSFKIEGRLRRAGYVAEAVDCYRRALDGDTDYKNFEYRLKKVFSRGEFLSRAYLDGGVPEIVNPEFSNHRGIAIGEVLSVSPFKDIYKIKIKSNHDIKSGDGLKLIRGGVEAASLGAGNINAAGGGIYELFTSAKAAKGDKVHLISDAEAENRRNERNRKVNFKVTALSGQNLKIFAESGSNFEFISDYICPPALSRETEKEEIALQLKKCGGSGFAAGTIEIQTDGVFIPKSVINEARRQSLIGLKAKIIEDFENEITAGIDAAAIEETLTEIENSRPRLGGGASNNLAECPKPSVNLHYVYGEEDIPEAAEENTIFALSLENLKELDFLVKSLKEKFNGAKLAYNLPILANGRDFELIERALTENRNDIKTVIANNIYGLAFKEKGFEVIAGFGLNTANSLQAAALKEAGAAVVTPSLEFGLDTLVLPLANPKNFKLPLMTLAHCPYRSTTFSSCKNCRAGSLTLENGGRRYKIRRYKLSRCYFEVLKDE